MRRSERKISNFKEIIDVVNRCEILRLGMVDREGKAYIVPLSFGFEVVKNNIIFYFHSAKEGRKMEILRRNPLVCFEMEAQTGFISNKLACRWSARFETVMGEGRVHFITDVSEKEQAFRTIMKCNGYEGEPTFNPEILARTEVCRIEVCEFSGKRNLGIEKAKTSDIPEIITVWESSVKATHDFLKPEDFEFYKSMIPKFLGNVDLYVLCSGESILAFMGISDENLEMLFVAGESRGKGYGKQLLETAISKYKITKVDVNEENKQAVDFYKKFGFKIISRSEKDSMGKDYPILHLER